MDHFYQWDLANISSVARYGSGDEIQQIEAILAVAERAEHLVFVLERIALVLEEKNS